MKSQDKLEERLWKMIEELKSFMVGVCLIILSFLSFICLYSVETVFPFAFIFSSLLFMILGVFTLLKYGGFGKNKKIIGGN